MVDDFYSKNNKTTALASLQKVNAVSEAQILSDNRAIDLTTKTDNELISLLTHRDVNMRQRALLLIKAKITSEEESREKEKSIALVLENLKVFTGLLNSANTQETQLDALRIVLALING